MPVRTAKVLDRHDLDELVSQHGAKACLGCGTCKDSGPVHLEYEVGSGAILVTCGKCRAFVVAVRVASRTQGQTETVQVPEGVRR